MAAIVGDNDVLNSVADYFIDHYENRVKEGSTVAGKCMFVCSLLFFILPGSSG